MAASAWELAGPWEGALAALATSLPFRSEMAPAHVPGAVVRALACPHLNLTRTHTQTHTPQACLIYLNLTS
eukprot:8518405-Lingulodinium_polyedra.AAC.1